MTVIAFLAVAGFFAGGAISVARRAQGRRQWLWAVLLAGTSSLFLGNALLRW